MKLGCGKMINSNKTWSSSCRSVYILILPPPPSYLYLSICLLPMWYRKIMTSRWTWNDLWFICLEVYWAPVKIHDDVIKWKHFPRNWPFVRGIHRSPVNSPHKGQWREALMFSLICVWINNWVHNREAGDLRRYLAHYDVIVTSTCKRLAMVALR